MALYQYSQYEQQNAFFDLSAGPINGFDFFNLNTGRKHEEFDGAKPPRKRRDDTNVIVNSLYEATLTRRSGEREIVRTGGRKNKNEILGLTNARLIKEKHLNGTKYSRDVELVRGIQMNVSNGEFVLVLRTDGRIVAMSDEVEQHLGKTMRSLYTQCINIFECLDNTDGENLQSILNSPVDLAEKEHRLVCTFRLPKGKRPSRAREDIQAISMAGHFYSCHDSCHDRLFVVRCEALVSRTTNGTSSSQTAPINNTMVKITLNDDMTVSMMSPNVKEVLGYSKNEMIGKWFGRFLATNDLEKFENIRQIYFRNEQQTPTNVCDIFDLYTNNGDNRLTFLCQIRPIRERRSKLIKYSIVAQLIDPSMRDEYLKYVLSETEPNQAAIKVEQVNLVSPAMPKASEDSIVAHSPSLSMGLLMFDNINNQDIFHQSQLSPFNRSLSNVVAPFIFDDEPSQFLEYEYDQCSAKVDMQYWSPKVIDDTYFKCQLDDELASIDALINDF
jgi:PAS domain-containing protein